MGGVTSEPLDYKPETADDLVPYEEKGKYWAVEPSAELKVRLAKNEKSLAALPPSTVMAEFKKARDKQGKKSAYKFENPEGTWNEVSWEQYYDDVMTFARSLIKVGYQPHESVNIIGFNSPEWFTADLGAIAAGGMAAGIYTTNGPEACRYICEHSEARVVVVEDVSQLNKVTQIRDTLPKLQAIVMYKGDVPEGANKDGSAKVYNWADFMALGNADDKADLQKTLDERLANQKPGHCCTLIYTSGTTGPPKAVMISNDNCTWTATVTLTLMPDFGSSGEERLVSYLPLSHIAAQMLDIHAPIIGSAQGHQTVVAFARPTALKGTLKVTLQAHKPTFFFGVPRVWEKMAEAMQAIGKQTTGLKKSIGDWAKKKGLEHFKASEVTGSHESSGLGFSIADKLVFSKIRAALGLSDCRLCLTGAAPISQDTLNYFGSLNIHIHELYGMSESTGPHTSCRFRYRQTGSCGVNIPGVETKIDHVDGRDKEKEGEICFRGRHIMMGYMKDVEKTEGTIDPEGWLHSGDVGRVDENNLLYITGRIKELIITAGGENVAPVPIEDSIKAELPAISNVIVIGDKKKFLSCLVTLKQELDEKTGGFTPNLTGTSLEVNPDVKTVEQAKADKKWNEYITEGIKRANKAAVSRAQVVQKFKILDNDFSVATGELTATLKLKRPVVVQQEDKVIEEMYAGGEGSD